MLIQLAHNSPVFKYFNKKTVKGYLVYDGSKTRDWVLQEEVASLTVAMESILLTLVIYTKEGHNVMTANIPNTFIQAHMCQHKEYSCVVCE